MITRRFILVCCCLFLVPLAPEAPALADKDKSEPIVVEEPHYGEILFYFYQEDYFPAIVRLLAAQEQAQLEQHAGQAELLKGGLYLSYGHHLEAADIFQRLLADNVNPEIRDRTWFFLAKIWRQRGYLDKAQQALDNIGGELPDHIQREATMLQAQLLIDGDVAGDAEGVFALSLCTDEQSIPLRGRVAWTEQVADRQYVVGISFTQVDMADLAALEHMIRMTCGGYAQPVCYVAA